MNRRPPRSHRECLAGLEHPQAAAGSRWRRRIGAVLPLHDPSFAPGVSDGILGVRFVEMVTTKSMSPLTATVTEESAARLSPCTRP